MNIISKDFVASGKPTYIVANAGITYLDIDDGTRYRQTTIPYGKNWIPIEKELVFIPGTVESVGLSTSPVVNPALSISGSPVTSIGTMVLNWNGNNTEYVAGDGSLVPFPSVATTVSGRANDVIVVLSGTNYEVQTAVSPMLLMGA